MSLTVAEQFVRRLEKLGAAQRAALKAEGGRPPQPDVPAFDAFTAAFWRHRETWLPRDVSRLVAALYFWHPQEGGRGNLAVALRRAAGSIRIETNEQLLRQLLAAPLSGLHGPLFEAVRRLATAHVRLDWPQLITDLSRWDRPNTDKGPSVQEKWAASWLNCGGKHAD